MPVSSSASTAGRRRTGDDGTGRGHVRHSRAAPVRPVRPATAPLLGAAAPRPVPDRADGRRKGCIPGHAGAMGSTGDGASPAGVARRVASAAPVGWPLVEQRALGRSGLVVSRLGAGHHDLGPGHRRGRGRDAAHGVRRRRRHAGRHRRRLLRRRERAHPRAGCSPTSSPASDVLVATKAVGRTGAGPDGPRRLPRAPAGRAGRLAGAAGPGPRRPLAAARLGRRARRWRRRWPPATWPSPPAGPATSAISNFTGWQTAQAATWQRAWPGRTPLVSTQVEYSLLQRGVEREVVPAAEALGLGVLAWSPLGRGLLTGKYRHSTPVGVPRRLAAVAGLHRRAALGARPTGSSRR